MTNLLTEFTQEEDTQKGKFLTFSLGKEDYGIEISNVKEIIGIQNITQVPELPPYVKGIINLRGKIIPVMDVRIRFKKEERDYNDRTCIIVIEIKEISVGLIVDTVTEVLAISEENIVPPPQMNKGSQSKYIKAIGKAAGGVKLILDCDRLLGEDELEELSEIA